MTKWLPILFDILSNLITNSIRIVEPFLLFHILHFGLSITLVIIAAIGEVTEVRVVK